MVRSATTAATRRTLIVTAIALLVGTMVLPGVHASTWPTTIALREGFRPEGIASAGGTTVFVGSIPTGDVVRADLRTGDVELLVDAAANRAAIGLFVRDGVLYVAGGPTGQGYAYDAETGDEIDSWQLTEDATFVNDVVATRDAVYFTDSVNPFLYRVPVLPSGTFGDPEPMPLTGDLVYEEGFNVNGIDATPDGGTLVVVQSNTGLLFTVDPDDGTTSQIDLGGDTVEMGDGILLDGPRLWVVQNRANLLTLVRLASDLGSGDVVRRSTHDDFDVPTTVARMGDSLALVNARFDTVAEPDEADYWVTRLRRPGS